MVEEGLSAGSTQDYVIQVVRFAHAWGKDRRFPGATPTHWGDGGFYLSAYRENLSAGRVGAQSPARGDDQVSGSGWDTGTGRGGRGRTAMVRSLMNSKVSPLPSNM